MWQAILGGAALNGAFNALGAGINLAQSKNFYNYQRQVQEDLFNKYMSPSAMREQYAAAGFNPYLAAGGSAELPAVGGSSISDNFHAPQTDFVSALQAGKQMEVADAQIGNLNSQSEFNRANTQARLIENFVSAKSAVARSELPQAEKDKLYKEIDNLSSSIEQRKYQNDKLTAETSNVSADTEIKSVQKDLMTKQIDTETAKKRLIDAQVISERFEQALKQSNIDLNTARYATEKWNELLVENQAYRTGHLTQAEYNKLVAETANSVANSNYTDAKTIGAYIDDIKNFITLCNPLRIFLKGK